MKENKINKIIENYLKEKSEMILISDLERTIDILDLKTGDELYGFNSSFYAKYADMFVRVKKIFKKYIEVETQDGYGDFRPGVVFKFLYSDRYKMFYDSNRRYFLGIKR